MVLLYEASVPEGIRTPDTWLRRPLLYPTELLAPIVCYTLYLIVVCFISSQDIQPHYKRVMGIEPTYLAWKASVLPLNYTRIFILFIVIHYDFAASDSFPCRQATLLIIHTLFLFASCNFW